MQVGEREREDGGDVNEAEKEVEEQREWKMCREAEDDVEEVKEQREK